MSFKFEKFRIPNSEHRTRFGFTMMELMFAIGIFAVGMSLVAGLFPAAIKESENTVKDYEGPIICENGLAIVKAKVKNSDANPLLTGNLAPLYNFPLLTIGDADKISRTYDTNGDNTPDRKRGFLTLVKRYAAGRNDYQVVIVAYDIAINNYIIAASLTGIGAIPDGQTQITYAGDKTGFTGSPFIDSDYGRYATIIGVDGNTIFLDHSIGEDIAGSDDPIVILEVDGSNTPQETSPVIGILVTRTALRE